MSSSITKFVHLSSFLSLYEQKPPESFYKLFQKSVFYYFRTAIQLISNLLRHRGTEVQKAVMEHPQGIAKLVDVIHDNREIIRNEAILMICELSRANSQVQQLLAYDNIFLDLLNIIETEPLDSERLINFKHFIYFILCFQALSSKIACL